MKNASGNFRLLEFFWAQFSYKELLEATENFSEDRMLSACTYRGDLKDLGASVAVKKMKLKSASAITEYNDKLEIVRRTRHRNLLKLWGQCSQGNYLYLVYEYVDNCILHYHLYNTETILSWPIR